jgi:carbamoylphosphate synthase small subunit
MVLATKGILMSNGEGDPRVLPRPVRFRKGG